MEKYYKISEEELLNLLEAQEELKALNSCGVDNWDGWEEAHSAIFSDYYEEPLCGFNMTPKLVKYEEVK